jgi:TPR repeat protein
MLKFCTLIACFLAISLTATHALSQDMSGWSDKTVCRILSQNPNNTEYLGEGVSRGLACASSTPSLKNIKPTKVESTESADYQKGQDAFDKDDYKTAFNEWQPLADQGYAAAQSSLGWLYENGKGVLEDDEQAIKWYQKAADQGYAKAQYDLGSMYRSSVDVRQKSELSVTWYKTLYATAKGVLKNDTEAVKWYRKAANQGYAEAQYGLGRMYDYGEGVRESDNQAVKWYQKAADQGYAKAQSQLGWMYQSGKGVRKDYKQAVKWYQKAADQGSAGAQKNIGWMYHNGKGVREDYKQAVKWYQKAADQGSAGAQYNVGWMYQNGKGVLKDDIQAVKWYRKAANQGYAAAQKKIGVLYRDGVVKDDGQAVEWDDQGNIKPISVKDYTGMAGLQIPVGTYLRQDLLEIASLKTSGLRQVFESINWMHSGKLASMDSEPGGLNSKRIIGFSQDATELKVAYDMRYKNGNLQVMLATWDIGTKQLQKLNVLAPETRSLAVSADQKWLAMADDRTNEKDELVWLYNIETNATSFIKIAEKSNSYAVWVKFTIFSNDSRYIAVQSEELWDKKEGGIDSLFSNLNTNIFQTNTGKLVATYPVFFDLSDRGSSITFSPDSSKFLLQWRCYECGEDKEGESLHKVGSTETWLTAPLVKFNGKYDRPVFSANSRYVLERLKAYDTQNNVDVEDYNPCEASINGDAGRAIFGSPLNLYHGDSPKDDFRFNVISDGACVRVRTDKSPITGHYRSDFIFSQDNKQLALISQNTADEYVIEVKPIQLPSDEEIARAIESYQAKKIKDDIKSAFNKAENDLYDRAQNAFDSGFPEQALTMVDKWMEKNPVSAGLHVNSVKSWVKKLPLKDIGKSILRRHELYLAQPVTTADGFSGGDVSVDKGFIAEYIFPGSTAETAGIIKGDVVIAVDGVAIKDEEDYKIRLKKYQVDDVITLSLLRNNNKIELLLTLEEGRKGIIWGLLALVDYGVIASAAGHPELTKQAAEKLHILIQKYKSQVHSLKVNNFVIALESLALASQGNSDAAYTHAFQKGGFVNEESDIFLTFHINNSVDNIFLTPLFQDRKKFAYLLGIDESDLPETPTHVFPTQPYPDLNGKVIGAGKAQDETPVKKKEVEFEFID